MIDKPFKTLDHDFREGLRARIEAGTLVQKLQCFALNPVAYPMSRQQVTVALSLLEFVLPKLKAVEHTDVPRRAETREELIERLAQLHARTTPSDERRGVAGTGAVDGAAELRH
jgi:hypothetical protein